MAMIRHYVMTAGNDRADELKDALFALAAAVRAIPGCEAVEVLRDADRAERFVFIERWASVDAHKQGAAALPKELMGAVMAPLAGRPEAAWLTPA